MDSEMQIPSANPYVSPEAPDSFPSKSTRGLRWQVAPATLSVLLGVILFVMNCIHLLDAMIPEIQRSFASGNGFMVAHGVLCMIASLLFFGASACAVLAARSWLRGRYRMAISLDVLGVPSMLCLGVFLMYFSFY
jgi:hypothetical protein